MARTKKRFRAIQAEKQELTSKLPTRGQWRTGLYARLSVDSADPGKDSIDSQLDILRGYFRDRSEFSILHEYIDRGWSGTNFHRPAFEEMMEDVRSGRINCIATKDLSRLGRDYLETSSYVETIFPFLGIRYISVNDHFDTAQEQNGNKDLEIALKNLVNDMYARDVSRRMSTARRQEQLKGRFVGSNPPYGYRVDETSLLRRFAVDEPAARVVRSIFEMALDRRTLRAISLRLQEQRLRTPGSYLKTGKLYLDPGEAPQQWYIGTISAILSNEAYTGKLVQGKRRARLYSGEKQHVTEREDWVVSENTHCPIIMEETFLAVRALMEQKRRESCFSKVQTTEFPVKPDKYEGLIYCGICGRKMSYVGRLSGEDDRKRQYRYECRNNYQLGKDKPCRTSINEKMLDPIVMQMLGDLLRSLGEDGNAVSSACHETLHEASDRMEKEIRKNRRQIENIDEAERMDYEEYVLGSMTRDAYLQKREAGQEKRNRQQAILQGLESDRDAFLAKMQEKDHWLQTLAAGSEGEPDHDLLHTLLKRIDIYPEHEISISYPFTPSDFFPEGANAKVGSGSAVSGGTPTHPGETTGKGTAMQDTAEKGGGR